MTIRFWLPTNCSTPISIILALLPISIALKIVLPEVGACAISVA